MSKDNWSDRSTNRVCSTCQFVCEKKKVVNETPRKVGRCRRHAPTTQGYPVVFMDDWCGDWKLDENKVGVLEK